MATPYIAVSSVQPPALTATESRSPSRSLLRRRWIGRNLIQPCRSRLSARHDQGLGTYNPKPWEERSEEERTAALEEAKRRLISAAAMR